MVTKMADLLKVDAKKRITKNLNKKRFSDSTFHEHSVRITTTTTTEAEIPYLKENTTHQHVLKFVSININSV